MITHIVSDWLFSPCCVEHQDEFIFERVAVAYSRDYNEVGRAQIKQFELFEHFELHHANPSSVRSDCLANSHQAQTDLYNVFWQTDLYNVYWPG